jgi:hypothetical protein
MKCRIKKRSTEAKAVLALRDKLAEAFKARNASIGPAYNVAQTNVDAILLQFPAATEAFRAASSELMETNMVYFQPPPGEDFISDEVYAAIVAASSKANTAVKLDGTTVDDFRGTTYWTATKKGVWSAATIDKLGDTVPSGAILDADLTADQKTEIAAQTETERLAALSDAQRLAEATAAKAAALAESVQTQSAELIAGKDSATALADAQAQYKAALSEINSKYSTSLTA